MSSSSATPPEALSSSEREILRAIRELQFGTVEVIVHEGKVMEVRQTKRSRFADVAAAKTPRSETFPKL